MYEELDVGGYRPVSPPLINSLTEIPRTLIEMSALMAALPLLGGLPRGDGHRILVLPGFMAGDESTLVLRRYLKFMNYDALPWKLGRNTGRPELMKRLLIDRFMEVSDDADGKISIIGQSLGGVFGRELARIYPDRVRQLITLGSPFGTRSSSTTLPLVTRRFELESGLTIEQMREFLSDMDPHKSPPVPITAIYSKGDGIVNWRVCMEEAEDEQTQNIEVCGSHCGMGFNALIYYIVADRLHQAEGEWRKFVATKNMRLEQVDA